MATTLTEAARHVIAPPAVATAWPSVSGVCQQLEVTFDPWQHGAGRLIHAKRADGRWACTTVTMSIPRQVGKTFLIGWIILARCIMEPGTIVLWTAHRAPTADLVYEELAGLAKNGPVSDHVKRAAAPAGNGVIEFHNGSKIMFGARERGFGRGFKKVSVVVFDEAQILTEAAVGDMVPAANRAPNRQVFYIGTPPDPRDPSEVFTRQRRRALEGKAGNAAYIEFSAHPLTGLFDERTGKPLGPAIDDSLQWMLANPSYPEHTDDEAMLLMLESLTEEQFRREALGIWDDERRAAKIMPAWPTLDVVSLAPGRPAPLGLAIAGDQDLTNLHLVAAWHLEDGRHLVERLVTWPAVDVDEFAPVVLAAQEHAGVVVSIAGNGPATDLAAPVLERAGVMLNRAALADQVGAHNDLVLTVAGGRLVHTGDQQLTDAAEDVTWKTVTDKRVFARKVSDVSPVEAAALALADAKAYEEAAIY